MNRRRPTRYKSKRYSALLVMAAYSGLLLGFAGGRVSAPTETITQTKIVHVPVPACGKLPDNKHSQAQQLRMSQLWKGN